MIVGKNLFILCGLAGLLAPCSALSMSLPKPKGSAAKPFEKQKVAVFGGGGYMGGLIFGFLQRASSLYGTGLQNVRAPRVIAATGFGSIQLNGILSKHFILAQADESFIKLTDMTSQITIQERVEGMDAVILGTRYTLEQRPVASGTYEKSPNDKAREIYLDVARSSTLQGIEDPEFGAELFENSLAACKSAGVKHIVCVETDSSFDATPATETYVKQLQSAGVPFTYIRPLGKLENIKDYTYVKGVQGDLQLKVVDLNASQGMSPSLAIPREDIAALCVQSLLSLDWSSSRILCVSCTGPVSPLSEAPKLTNREWCVNSDTLAAKFGGL